MSSSSSAMRPSTRAPGITSCMRLIVRSAVDLPQPEGPMNAVIDRSSMTIDRSSIAWNPP